MFSMKFDLNLFMKEFKNPSAIMRTAPLWVWNDRMTDSQIDKSLHELKNHGFGGAVIHPRPGMRIPYLSKEWFTQWGYALEGAKKLDMKLYIYDENSYPSGFGGGHVSAELPDCLGTSVSYELVHKDRLPIDHKQEKWFSDTSVVRAFACERTQENEISLIRDLTETPIGQWVSESGWYVLMKFVKPVTTGWLAGFANVDLLRREVTDEFIQKVYQPYYEHFGSDFGKTIPAIFMDEPAITGSGVYGSAGGNVLPYSFWFAYEFYKRNGYHLEDHLPALFAAAAAPWFVHDYKKVRYDYYTTVRELWVQNFIKPLSDWCQDHHIALTGHYMEDEWPRASAQTTSPNIMANFEYMGWPAIDMLVNDKLIDRPNEPVNVIMHELHSAVNQFGQERCFCEAFGAGGWDSTLSDFKRIGDWLMAGGVNFINEHLTYTSYIGARKRDHPQSFDWRQPWWNQYTKLNDYFARACFSLSQGHMQQRILLMHPTSTGYLRVMDDEPSNLVVEGTLAKEPDMRPYLSLIQQLTDEWWDFDLGNEEIMKRHGKVKNGRLQINNQNYEVVIITKEMQNFFKSTLSILERFMEEGGRVLSLGIPGSYVDGQEDAEVITKLLAHRNWMSVDDSLELMARLSDSLKNRVAFKYPSATGLEHMRRRLGDGYDLYFIINHSLDDQQQEFTLNGSKIFYLDLWDGQIKNYPYTFKDGKVTFDVSLDRFESVMFFVGDEGGNRLAEPLLYPVYQKPSAERKKEAPITLSEIVPESFNTLMIEYCDLQLNGRQYEDMLTIFAGKEIFKHRGFTDNPWDNQVQYKRRYIDSNHYDDHSGFTAYYKFHVKDLPPYAELVVEQGREYQIRLNGQPVTWKEGYYLDELNTIAEITKLLIQGENIVELHNRQFDICLELEPVYVRGNFAVESSGTQWTITKPRPLSLGTWITQGYPMYEGAVYYHYDYRRGTEKEITAVIPHMETTCASLIVNGTELGLVGINGNYVFDVSRYCTKDVNRITLRVCGGFKNLLGPHHCKGNPRRTAWPNMWRESPRYIRPAPEQYDLIAYGLAEDIHVFVK